METTVYDFQNPNHKLTTRWPVLDLVGAGIALSFSSLLGEKLQLPLRGEGRAVQRMSYVDTVSSMGRTCVVHELNIEPLSGLAWFCMDTSVISAIVESYFGGNGQVVPVNEPRALSHTELRVLRHIVEAFLKAIVKGWSIVLPVHPSVSRQLPVDRMLNVTRHPVMVINQLALRAGEVELPCQLVYPYEMLVPLSERLQHESESAKQQDEAFSRGMKRELMNCELDIRGVLAETQITLGKLLELKPGDFIPLRDVEHVAFKTDNMPLFDARVGSSNGRVSASLSRWHLPIAS
jgi:flagellar motor switch protein FliM